MGDCIVCMCVCVLCAKYLQNPEESFESPEIEVTDVVCHHVGVGSQTPSSLQKYPVFLETLSHFPTLFLINSVSAGFQL